MLFNLDKIFGNASSDMTGKLSKDQIAQLLKTTPEALQKFEKSYKINILDNPQDNNNIFEHSAKQAADSRINRTIPTDLKDIISRIVDELLEQTDVLHWNGKHISSYRFDTNRKDKTPVSKEELDAIPNGLCPDLTGHLMKRQVPGSTADALLWNYMEWQKARGPKAKQMYYNMFRQGLDILDLDEITYEILGMNKNAMGYWLPALCTAITNQSFFKVPETHVIKVPLPLLQLSRLDYTDLSSTTMSILDEYTFKVFELDETKEYFIKTGTFSSKFDFRNAHVSGAKEVHELGEYLLFISNQAVIMASPTTQPCMYGVSTTNEWVVREFITDPDNNPTIYKGLPLRTEYRVFVDLDNGTIIGKNPYWDPDTMLRRFGQSPDSDDMHIQHDYITYCANKDRLSENYNKNIQTVTKHLKAMLPDMNAAGLTGQWSIDIMQSGNDFYVIDMALAEQSAYYNCVPDKLRRPSAENWLPDITDKME